MEKKINKHPLPIVLHKIELREADAKRNASDEYIDEYLKHLEMESEKFAIAKANLKVSRLQELLDIQGEKLAYLKQDVKGYKKAKVFSVLAEIGKTALKVLSGAAIAIGTYLLTEKVNEGIAPLFCGIAGVGISGALTYLDKKNVKKSVEFNENYEEAKNNLAKAEKDRETTQKEIEFYQTKQDPQSDFSDGGLDY